MTNENGVTSFLIQFFIPLKNANHDKSFDYNGIVGTFLLQQPDNKSFFREGATFTLQPLRNQISL